MDRPDGDAVGALRRWILWVLVLGLVGTEVELLLLEHYEELWQFVPLALIALAVAVLVWHARRHDAASRRTLQIVMLLFLVASVVGLALHFRGAAEFQLELDRAMGKWDLVRKAMRAKAPPVLAPGVMLLLGLVGLVYTLSDSGEEGVR